jgi:hypothetical protein
MRVWYRGFTIRSEKNLLDGKLNRFIVARIFTAESISNMRTAGKKSKRNKRWKRK